MYPLKKYKSLCRFIFQWMAFTVLKAYFNTIRVVDTAWLRIVNLPLQKDFEIGTVH